MNTMHNRIRIEAMTAVLFVYSCLMTRELRSRVWDMCLGIMDTKPNCPFGSHTWLTVTLHEGAVKNSATRWTTDEGKVALMAYSAKEYDKHVAIARGRKCGAEAGSGAGLLGLFTGVQHDAPDFFLARYRLPMQGPVAAPELVGPAAVQRFAAVSRIIAGRENNRADDLNSESLRDSYRGTAIMPWSTTTRRVIIINTANAA